MRAVYLQFVQEVFKLPADSAPRYDHLNDVINTQIEKILKPNETPLFTWLSDAEKQQAIQELTNHPLPEISTITLPENFDNFTYPDVRNGSGSAT